MTHFHCHHLSLAIVTSPYGRCGGSLFAWEAYMACRRYSISAILATFDHRHHYPEIGPDLRRITFPRPNLPSSGTTFDQIVAEARSSHRFLIIDLPAGFGEDDGIKLALKNSGVTRSSTIACLVPLMPGQPNTWAAALGVDSFEGTGIFWDRGLFRFWDIDPGLFRPDFPDLPGFPFWTAPTLSRGAVAAIHGARPQLKEVVDGWLPGLASARSAGSTPVPEPRVTREVADHLEEATAAIHNAILAPTILPRMAA